MSIDSSSVQTGYEGTAMTKVAGSPPKGSGQALHTSSGARKVVVYGLLLFFALLYLYPFVVQLVTAFKTNPDAVAHPLTLVPRPFTGKALDTLFANDFALWFTNSVVVAVCVTVGRVFFDSLAGYALARLRFPGRSAVFNAVIAVMAVPGVVLLIPKFLVLNYLSMYNTYPALIVPLIADAAGVFIMKQFFESIPASVEEAARIDGASTFRIFWSIVLPMAAPAVMTIVILSFQGSWNELNHFIVSTQDPDKTVLTKGVAQLASGQLSQGTQYPLKLGAAALMTIPVAIVFFVFQKRIMNASAGALKE
jgi:multiple sugar transport system permease protein